MDYIFLYVLLFMIVAAVFLFKRAKSSPVDKTALPYSKIGNLFTPAERSFYGVLCQATKGKAIVFGKVRVADILKTKSGLSNKVRQIAFNRISGKHFDFVLCHPDDLSVIATVELDDSSHNTKKSIKRDQFLEAACKSANLILHRFKASHSYQVTEIREAIFPTVQLGATDDSHQLNSELETNEKSPTPDNQATTTSCPKCSSDLVTRTVKKGDNKGNQFLACSTFPKCRYTLHNDA